jgi:hypothetical protein
MTISEYVLSECKRQWNENQKEIHGEWDLQGDDTKAEYFNEMYDHLGILKVGDKFKIDTSTCEDPDLVGWYIENDYPILTVDEINGSLVLSKECEYGVEMIETYKVD